MLMVLWVLSSMKKMELHLKLFQKIGITIQSCKMRDGNILYNVDPDGNQTPIRYIEDGADMQIEVEVDGGDGVPDNPGEVTWEKPVRTNNYANNNFNLGLSATLSIPLG